jgi:hypothetical protein
MDPSAFLRPRGIRHAREQATQGGRELATTIERGTDRGGFCLGYNEHTGSMGTDTPRPPPAGGRGAPRASSTVLASTGGRAVASS